MTGPQTYDEAVTLYRAGDYSFSPPPVCTARWTESDWIMSIWGLKPETIMFQVKSQRIYYSVVGDSKSWRGYKKP